MLLLRLTAVLLVDIGNAEGCRDAEILDEALEECEVVVRESLFQP